jgi:Protein of unknown function (DUF3102)
MTDRPNVDPYRRLKELAEGIQGSLQAERGALASAGRSIIATGEQLIEARELIEHGEWETWVVRECHISADTALNYMKVAKSRKIREMGDAANNISRSILYQLADGKFTPETENDIIKEATTGKTKVSPKRVHEMTRRSNPKSKSSPSVDELNDIIALMEDPDKEFDKAILTLLWKLNRQPIVDFAGTDLFYEEIMPVVQGLKKLALVARRRVQILAELQKEESED